MKVSPEIFIVCSCCEIVQCPCSTSRFFEGGQLPPMSAYFLPSLSSWSVGNILILCYVSLSFVKIPFQCAWYVWWENRRIRRSTITYHILSVGSSTAPNHLHCQDQHLLLVATTSKALFQRESGTQEVDMKPPESTIATECKKQALIQTYHRINAIQSGGWDSTTRGPWMQYSCVSWKSDHSFVLNEWTSSDHELSGIYTH